MAELRATYRLQLGPHLDLHGARALVPYLRDLGVSHVYLSPVMQARTGSAHGYDVVDPTRVSSDLGGEAALRALADEGLGIIVDFVPNHMAATDENPFWRDAPERYFDVDLARGRRRRFFDVDDLVGVRVEDPHVFSTLHERLLALAADGVVDGVRIDHIDGLADPAGYLARLRDGGIAHVWVEKILEPGEPLRDWPVEGTTGYEFLNDAMGLFVDRTAEEAFTALAGDERSFAEVAQEAKHEQVRTTFVPEVDWLRSVDDVPGLEVGLAELPVYRTYVDPVTGGVDPFDREVLAAVPETLRRRLTLDDPGPPELVVRFQQTSGAVMAKGVEDTAYYRYVRLLALNEVGGNPGRFGTDDETAHEANAARLRHWPRALLAAQTHDTKRALDVRSRLVALTWIRDRWIDAVGAWHECTSGDRVPGAPDWSEELLVYQTLVGAWPIESERLHGYLTKAMREAKRATSWIAPDEEHERHVVEFAVGLASHPGFLDRFEPLIADVARLGEAISVGQVALRCTVPGVPDVYQGGELWDLSLVDPDNRRPVDWDRRRDALARLRASAPPTRETAKLFTISTLLDLRRRRPDLVAADYHPIPTGSAPTFAFGRGDDVVVLVPTRDAPVDRGAGPAGDGWRDLLAPLADVLSHPPAVYERVR